MRVIKVCESKYYLPLDKFTPNPKNPKKHTKEQIEHIKRSIIEFDFNDPIATWGTNFMIVEGHGRVEALKALVKDGWSLPETGIPYIPLDKLTPAQRDAYMIEHNYATQETDFDMDTLDELIKGLNDDGIDMGMFGLGISEDGEDEDDLLDDRYSKNKGEIIYEPKETSHRISDLYEVDTRFDEDIAQIQDEELREMLKIRAAWFAKFDFAKIADYYAYQASPQEQEIFERLALVLLDEDKLYENGFANLMRQVDEDDEDGGEDDA